MSPRHGWRPRETEAFALRLGVDVSHPGGEAMFSFPGLRPVRMNRRRNDTSRAVVAFLRRVAALKGAPDKG